MGMHLAIVAAGLAVQLGGNTPLNDLGTGRYQGFEGGLYSGGVNQPPTGHVAAALHAANQIRLIDPGPTSDSGRIVLLSIGMSNTTHEFSVFERQEDLNATRNGSLVVINTALGGQDSTTIRNPGAPYWGIVDARIQAMGCTPNQVQIVWLKEAMANPPNDFPGHALQLKADLGAIVRILKDKFPNLRLCYLSSRIYGGYSSGGLNPEPQAFEGGFSVKWLIEDQIAGDPSLNYDPARGPVEAPVLLWGPYLWADGINPRSDGLVWLRADLENDGTHPAPSGEQKVADMLSSFFASDPSVRPWYRKWPGIRVATVGAIADAYVSSSQPNTNFGTSQSLFVQGGGTVQTTYLKFDVRGALRPVLCAKLGLRLPTNGTSADGLRVSAVADSTWTETGITYANAPPIGSTIRTVPRASRDGTICCDVAGAVNSDQDGIVTFALTLPTNSGVFLSRESGQPPRLTLSLRSP